MKIILSPNLFFVKSIHVYANTITFIFTISPNVSIFMVMDLYIVSFYNVTKNTAMIFLYLTT